jgi:hypothetical protein
MSSVFCTFCLWWTSFQFALIACIVGMITAFAELLTRYNYDYRSIATSKISWVYMLLNGFAGIGAFYMIKEFNILNTKEWVKGIVAGTSAMLILRSSFVTIKGSGERQIDIGLAAILQIFLQAASRSFSQERAIDRLGKLDFMKAVDFEKAKIILPSLVLNIMKDLGDEEKQKIIDRIQDVSKSTDPNEAKSVVLGIILADLTDINLLKAAVEQVYSSIKFEGTEKQPEPLDEVLTKLNQKL